MSKAEAIKPVNEDERVLVAILKQMTAEDRRLFCDMLKAAVRQQELSERKGVTPGE